MTHQSEPCAPREQDPAPRLLSIFLAAILAIVLFVAFRPAHASEVAPTAASATLFPEYGTASWYGPNFDHRATASGEKFSIHLRTAAHRNLPLGTRVIVTNLANGRALIVRINDRGPYVAGRVIDLSQRAARELAMVHSGLVPVRIEIVGHD